MPPPVKLSELEALRRAHAALLERRFGAALEAARPFRAGPTGALLHALALAGTGAVAEAAPLLAAIAAANPASRHPVLDLLPLLDRGSADHLRAALALRPDDAGLWSALGQTLSECGPAADMLDAFRRAADLRPADPAAWANLAKALAAHAEFPAADAAFATARRLAPEDRQIAYNHALALLKAGRLREGWPALAVRHLLPRRPAPPPGPQLHDLDVAGRTVLLLHDEGYGDTLQFIRYAAPLAERGARIVAAMPPPLQRAIATAPGVAEVVGRTALPAYDRWAWLLDLPALFGEAIPATVPYLRAGPPPGLPPGRRVGLVWAGDPAGVLDRVRSMPVGALEPLRAATGVTWISLQHGAAPPGWVHPMPPVRDFADTAAIVAGLDAVVSVDTAVAHLAAALGKPVLLMDRFDACWRWLTGREDSPWYPTLRIVRQASPGDWAGVVVRVRAALSAPARP